jgi:hypothetical protein
MATEADIQNLLDQANGMPLRAAAKGALLEDAVRHADASGLRQAALGARRDLAVHYATLGLPDQAVALFARSLAEIDAYPQQFGPGTELQVLSWYVRIVRQLSEFPEVSRTQIQAALADLESRVISRGLNPIALFDARRWIAQTMGDWDAEERAYQTWLAAGGSQPGDPRSIEVEVARLILRDDPALIPRALELAMPTLIGASFAVEVRSLTLLGLLQSGHVELAARSYRIGLAQLHRDGTYFVETCARYIRFAALTGNFELGLDTLATHLSTYRRMNRPTGKAELAAAIQLLLTPLVASGRGSELVHVCGTDDHWSLADILSDAIQTVTKLTVSFDARNGNTNFGARVRAEAVPRQPLVKYLPLPTIVRCTVPAPLPAGLSAEHLVVTAGWFADRAESGEADRYLAAVTTVPPSLVAKLAELRARSAWDATSADAFTAAAKEYKASGDDRGRLVCQAWTAFHLGSTSPRMGGILMNAARSEAAKSDCAEAVAVSEWLGALMHRDRGPKQYLKAYQSSARAVEAAHRAGTPLWLGRAKLAEAIWLIDDGRPNEAVAAALAAKTALRAVGATHLLARAYDYLVSALLEMGLSAQLVSIADQELAGLPRNAPTRLRAALRGMRASGLVWQGQAGAALDDVLSAAAEERANGFDGYRRGYELAAALAANGGDAQALLELEECTEWASTQCAGNPAADRQYCGAALGVAILELYAALALRNERVNEAINVHRHLLATCPDPGVQERNRRAAAALGALN